MNVTARATVAALFFLLIFLSGIGLSRMGRPLNVGISTLHKLISLAAGVFLLVTIYQRNLATPLNGLEWVLIVVTGLFFTGTVASGGILSTDRPVSVAALRAHQILPVLAAVSSGVLLYLTLGR
jgi:hypothetical protein